MIDQCLCVTANVSNLHICLRDSHAISEPFCFLLYYSTDLSIILRQGNVAIIADATGVSLLRAVLPASAVSVQLPFAARGIATTPVRRAAAESEKAARRKAAQEQSEQVSALYFAMGELISLTAQMTFLIYIFHR